MRPDDTPDSIYQSSCLDVFLGLEPPKIGSACTTPLFSGPGEADIVIIDLSFASQGHRSKINKQWPQVGPNERFRMFEPPLLLFNNTPLPFIFVFSSALSHHPPSFDFPSLPSSFSSRGIVALVGTFIAYCIRLGFFPRLLKGAVEELSLIISSLL